MLSFRRKLLVLRFELFFLIYFNEVIFDEVLSYSVIWIYKKDIVELYDEFEDEF